MLMWQHEWALEMAGEDKDGLGEITAVPGQEGLRSGWQDHRAVGVGLVGQGSSGS